ncbi:TadE/TadG family type IV pilus assembly protein [Falsiroseomonas sp.]|uniref:TadE/TadG family type IV pilus assembly protein n=1 Tax=Falsiroseomonas sp. TaxID=2870721 RepID=UPI00356957DC
MNGPAASGGLPRFMSRCRMLRSRRGSVAVEWALGALVFAALLLTGMELGRYYFMAQSLQNLVGEVIRAAVVNTALGDGAEDCTTPKSTYAPLTPMINTADLLICVQRTRVGGTVTINVRGTIPYAFLTPILNGTSRTLSETSQYSYPGS